MGIREIESTREEYEVYDLVDAEDELGKTVKIKRVTQRVTLARVQTEIDNLTEQLAVKNKIKTDIQATLYRELVKTETGKYPDKTTVEVFTKTKAFGYQTLEAERDERDWILLKKRAQSMLKMIKAGCFPPCDPSSWICSKKWCGYYQSCSYTK